MLITRYELFEKMCINRMPIKLHRILSRLRVEGREFKALTRLFAHFILNIVFYFMPGAHGGQFSAISIKSNLVHIFPITIGHVQPHMTARVRVCMCVCVCVCGVWS